MLSVRVDGAEDEGSDHEQADEGKQKQPERTKDPRYKVQRSMGDVVRDEDVFLGLLRCSFPMWPFLGQRAFLGVWYMPRLPLSVARQSFLRAGILGHVAQTLVGYDALDWVVGLVFGLSVGYLGSIFVALRVHATAPHLLIARELVDGKANVGRRVQAGRGGH